MTELLNFWLLGAAFVFAFALRPGQATGGMMLTAVAAATWPLWACAVLIGMALDLLFFVGQFVRRPH